MKRVLPLIVLVVAGAAWGATLPMSKIAVSEGYRHVGILFWQLSISAVVLGGLCALRGNRIRLEKADVRLYVIIALIGTVLPGIASYSAAVHLPAGVLSMLLSSVPMLAFPVALALGNVSFRWKQLIGLSFGFSGVCLLIIPEASLPETVAVFWVFIALLSSLCYALEGNIVARFGTNGLDSVQVLCGASLVGTLIVLPLAVLSGQFIDPRGPWTAPDYAIVGSSLLHSGAYAAYVWLVQFAGPVFAVQISYLVTLFGVTWAMVFLNESYSPYFWAALAVMLAGLALVQPRPNAALVSAPEPDHT